MNNEFGKKLECIMKYLSLVILTLFIAACQPNEKSKTATTPLDTSCLNGQTICDTQVYSQNYGFTNYPVDYQKYGGYNQYYNNYISPSYQYYNNYYSYNYSTYANTWNSYYTNYNYGAFCDCPYGSSPVYNGQLGLGCVNNNVITPYLSFTAYFALVANNNSLVNLNQVPAVGSSTVGSCQSQLIQSCSVDIGNSCGAGLHCQPTSGGSRLGICVR